MKVIRQQWRYLTSISKGYRWAQFYTPDGPTAQKAVNKYDDFEAFVESHKDKDGYVALTNNIFEPEARKEEYVLSYCDLVIDFDAKHKDPDTFQSSDNDLKHIIQKSGEAKEILKGLGFTGMWRKKSGNGVHLHIPLCLDIERYDKKEIQSRCDALHQHIRFLEDDVFKFDSGATKTLSRVWKILGEKNYRNNKQKGRKDIRRCKLIDAIPDTKGLKDIINRNVASFVQLNVSKPSKIKKIAGNPVYEVNAHSAQIKTYLQDIWVTDIYQRQKDRQGDTSACDYGLLCELRKRFQIDDEVFLTKLHTNLLQTHGVNTKWLTRVNDSYRADTVSKVFQEVPVTKPSSTKITSFEDIPLKQTQPLAFLAPACVITEVNKDSNGFRNETILYRISVGQFHKNGPFNFFVTRGNEEPIQRNACYSWKQVSSQEVNAIVKRIDGEVLTHHKHTLCDVLQISNTSKKKYSEKDVQLARLNMTKKANRFWYPCLPMTKEDVVATVGELTVWDFIKKYVDGETRDDIMDMLLAPLILRFPSYTRNDYQVYSPHMYLSTNSGTTKTTTAELYSSSKRISRPSQYFISGGGNGNPNQVKEGFVHNRNAPTVLDEAKNWGNSKNYERIDLKELMGKGYHHPARGHAKPCLTSTTFVILENPKERKDSQNYPAIYAFYKFATNIIEGDEAWCRRIGIFTMRTDLKSMPEEKNLDRATTAMHCITHYSTHVLDSFLRDKRVKEWHNLKYSDDYRNSLMEQVIPELESCSDLSKPVVDLAKGMTLNFTRLRHHAFRRAILMHYPIKTLLDTSHNFTADVDKVLELAESEFHWNKMHVLNEFSLMLDNNVSMRHMTQALTVLDLPDYQKLLVFNICVQAVYLLAQEGVESLLQGTESTKSTKGNVCFFKKQQKMNFFLKDELARECHNYVTNIFPSKKYNEFNKLVSKYNGIVLDSVQKKATRAGKARDNEKELVPIDKVNIELNKLGIHYERNIVTIVKPKLFEFVLTSLFKIESKKFIFSDFYKKHTGTLVLSVLLVPEILDAMQRLVENTLYDLGRKEGING